MGEMMQQLQRLEARSPPPCTAKSFKNALLKKYGKLEYAWEDIDLNGDGVLQFVEFVAVCRKIQFVGNLHKVFDELTKNTGKDLTPDALEAGLSERLTKLSAMKEHKIEQAGEGLTGVGLSSAETLSEADLRLTRASASVPPLCAARAFKAALIKKFGSLEHAWHQLDANGVGFLNYHEFVAACRHIQFVHVQFVGNLRKIYDELKGKNEEYLTPDGLEPGLAKRLAKRLAGKVCAVDEPARGSSAVEARCERHGIHLSGTVKVFNPAPRSFTPIRGDRSRAPLTFSRRFKEHHQG
eukprot:gnl/TRDRNA2_/TRDRNA2_144414_c1_seq2.p1 gnl/TRDRNA2_/TRDRNA2_144414_c1~~gnl/TRDRNA2_/TRDRNA2_144414_c1_seq2.p1  ORF type:complete len:346 (+),score=63.93 gnl/TRDRNA2_/TRDRNA2_144414_c1_seq2:153-1040(+)